MDIKSLYELEKPIYVLGYGSLMYPDGINGRGMQHLYGNSDLCICTLNGWERGMTAKWGRKLYYGIYATEDKMINGVLFPVHTLYDLHMLNQSEGISGATGEAKDYKAGQYTLTQLDTSAIECDELPEDAIVLSYVINDIPIGGKDAPNYCEHVDDGIKMWGKEFIEVFNATSTNKN